MGMIADLKNLDSVDATLNANATKRVLKRYIQDLEATQGDPAYADADVSARLEDQIIGQHVPTVSGGTYDLIFDLANGETFTVATVAFNAVVATIKTAINSAATSASITGWVDDDISVTGAAGLDGNDVNFVFATGVLANRRQPLIQIDGTSLTGGGSAGAVTINTHGQPNRSASAVAKLINLIIAAQPISILPISSDYATTNPGDLHLNPNELVLNMLATEMGIEDADFGLSNGAAVRDKHLEFMRTQGFAV